MKRFIPSLLLAVALAVFAVVVSLDLTSTALAKTAYHRTALTGNTAASLDGIDGAGLTDGDFAFVMASSVLYSYILDDDSGAAESSPAVISPDSNAGTKRWVLQYSYGYFNPAAPGTIGGTTPAAGTFTTLTVSGVIDGLSTVEAVNGKTITVKSGYYIATGTSNFVVPTPAAAGGNQYCFKQANAGTSAITVIPVHTSSVQLGKTDNSGYCDADDKLVSGGAATDQLCIVALDATHYMVFSSTGTWTCTAH